MKRIVRYLYSILFLLHGLYHPNLLLRQIVFYRICHRAPYQCCQLALKHLPYMFIEGTLCNNETNVTCVNLWDPMHTRFFTVISRPVRNTIPQTGQSTPPWESIQWMLPTSTIPRRTSPFWNSSTYSWRSLCGVSPSIRICEGHILVPRPSVPCGSKDDKLQSLIHHVLHYFSNHIPSLPMSCEAVHLWWSCVQMSRLYFVRTWSHTNVDIQFMPSVKQTLHRLYLLLLELQYISERYFLGNSVSTLRFTRRIRHTFRQSTLIRSCSTCQTYRSIPWETYDRRSTVLRKFWTLKIWGYNMCIWENNSTGRFNAGVPLNRRPLDRFHQWGNRLRAFGLVRL